MTLKELDQLHWFYKEIDMDTRRLRELEPGSDDIRAIIENKLAGASGSGMSWRTTSQP